MKKLFLLLIICTPFITKAQKVDVNSLVLPVKDNAIFYEEVVKVNPSLTTSSLYTSGKIWFVNYFKDAKAVVQLEDEAKGMIIGKGVLRYQYGSILSMITVYAECTISLAFKAGRYRYQIYDIKGTQDISGTSFPLDLNEAYTKYKNKKSVKLNYKILKGLDEQIQITIQSMKKAISVKTDNNF